uniref:Uncharacterized protein n=1 Tax=Oryza meridionalis TaxID=40149 RepID=A0A0E0BWZ1_9ORYZ
MVTTSNCGLKTSRRIEPHKGHTTHIGSHSKTYFACQPLSIYMSALVLSNLLKLYILNPIVTKRTSYHPPLFFIPLSLSLSSISPPSTDALLLHQAQTLFSSPIPSPPSLFPLPPAAAGSGSGGGSGGGGKQRWWRRGAAVAAVGSSGEGGWLDAAVLLPLRRCARRIWRRWPQRGGGSLTPPSSSTHDGADELADGVASLAAAGSPDPAVGSSDDGKAAGADLAAAGSSDDDHGGSSEATTTTAQGDWTRQRAGRRLLQRKASACVFAAPEPRCGACTGSSASSLTACETTQTRASSARLRRGVLRPQARVTRCTWLDWNMKSKPYVETQQKI